MVRWISLGRDFLAGALRQLPVETVLVVAAAGASMALVHDFDSAWVVRVVLAALVATPVAFAAHGLGRPRSVLAGALAAMGAFAAITYALEDLDSFSRQSFAWPYGLTLLAAVLLPFVAAARRFTPFVRRFFEQTTTWGLLYVVASAALGVVEYALIELFGVSAHFAADLHLLLTGAFVLMWLHALLPSEEAGRVPLIWRRMATAVGAPFVSVMLAILVAYELVVLVQGELPRNVLSPLIMTAGFVGHLCTLVIAAVTVEPVGSPALAPADPHSFTRRLTVRLVQAFPLVLLALLPMAAWALAARVEQYGWTPFRVVRLASLLCLAALSLWGTWRWWRKRAPLAWEVPAVVAIFALACGLGPTSAVNLSIASQAARLEGALDAAGVTTRVVPQVAPATRPVPEAQVQALRDSFIALGELGGEEAIRRVLSGKTEPCAQGWSGVDECLSHLGIQATDAPQRWGYVESEGPFEIAGGALHLVELREGKHPTGLEIDGTQVVLRDTAGAAVARAPLDGLIAGWRTSPVMLPTVLSLARPDATVAGQLAVRRVEVTVREDGSLAVTSVSGFWLPR